MSAIFPPLDDDGSTAHAPDPELARMRPPRHQIEPETSVSAGSLLDTNAWDRVGGLLVQRHFYRHEHQMIYTAIGVLVNARKQAAVITLFEQLQNLGQAQETGGL